MIDFLNSALGIVSSIIVILGLGAAATFVVQKRIKQKNSGSGNSSVSEGDATNISGSSTKAEQGSINVLGNNNTIFKLTGEGPVGAETPTATVDLKGTCQILFIDDEPLKLLISTLKKSGWKNIKRIDDTANLDLAEIRNADIIFVDIKGVGKELMFKNEGVGLAAELKKKYPMKGIVIYSATPEHNLFDPDIDKVDGRLLKNAEPIQFSDMIEQYGKPKN